MPKPKQRAKPNRQLSLITPFCVECGARGRLVRGEEIHGKLSPLAKKMFYRCDCGAYVGCHGATAIPMGRPAGLATRKARGAAHEVFDALWQAKVATGVAQYRARGKAYSWLARELGMKVADCHISHFDAETCQRVVDLCKPYVWRLRNRR